eukprot:jgi/Psemu1/185543/e_gw1.50.37.1
MPLGLAKDSMLNLAELAHRTEEDDDHDDHDANTDDPTKVDYDHFIHETNLTQVVQGEASISDQQTAKTLGNSNNIGNNNNIGVSVDVNNNNNNTSSSSSSSQKTETKSKSKKSRADPKTTQYAGFQADYHDFENYTSYDYYGDYTLTGSAQTGKKGQVNCWQCIFPWSSPEDDDDDDNDDDNEEEKEEQIIDNTDGCSDDVSLISAGSENALGEKLSEKDRQAVLARLRLAQPDGGSASANANASVDGTTSVASDGASESKPKGILRQVHKGRKMNHSTRSNGSHQSNKNNKQQQGKERRALFPAYEPKTEKKKDLHTTFSPMARVVTIKSSKEMDQTEKGNIWWQKPDYDEFRKTGRLVSRVMLQGGSEIWLATNRSWQLPNQGKAATLRRAMENVDKESTSDKWWHKFGHSRRGLEHIASIDEGRQRQANVKTSIRAVLTEQRRQKAFSREDPEKLRMHSIQNTSWAKDLALASGASDADAVSKNFDDGSRKSREFYLLKFSRAGKLNSATGPKSGPKQVMPAFMRPMISMSLKPNLLDANTTTRLHSKRVTADGPPSVPARTNQKRGAVSSEPIHDPIIHMGEESLAHKAAGFANGEEAVNMSAVLTGMGAIPKNTDAARARPVLA